MTAQKNTEAGEAKEVLGRMEAGVEFINDARAIDNFTSILHDYDMEGKAVAHVSANGLDFAHQLLEKNVAKCHVISPNELVSPDDRIICEIGRPWDTSASDLDYVFFDATMLENLDHVGGVNRLVERLESMLLPGALAFLVLRTGLVQSDWDVFNAILPTPLGRLPSSPYLYDVMLRDFAVRPLLRMKDDENKKHSVTRLFRITKRNPTLLLVIGHSQSGKTTLARSLREVDTTAHLSSDYIFYELFRQRAESNLPGCSNRLLDLIKGGSAEATGMFFRDIEANDEILREYLTLAVSLLPRHRHLVSMDIDLRDQKRIAFTKQFFTDAGFSVWVAER